MKANQIRLVELVNVSLLVAITIVVKYIFKFIPGFELTTPIFIVSIYILKLRSSILYVLIFLIVDTLFITNANLQFGLFNAVMWILIAIFTYIFSLSPNYRQFTISFVALISISFQTIFWLLISPIIFTGVKLSWEIFVSSIIFDYSTLHPIICVFTTFVLYNSLTIVLANNQYFRLGK